MTKHIRIRFIFLHTLNPVQYQSIKTCAKPKFTSILWPCSDKMRGNVYFHTNLIHRVSMIMKIFNFNKLLSHNGIGHKLYQLNYNPLPIIICTFFDDNK